MTAEALTFCGLLYWLKDSFENHTINSFLFKSCKNIVIVCFFICVYNIGANRKEQNHSDVVTQSYRVLKKIASYLFVGTGFFINENCEKQETNNRSGHLDDYL